MGTGISQDRINRKLRYLKKKNPNQEYVVLRASNGEVAIVTKEYHEMCTVRWVDGKKID
ncbi:MAG: hypothetical protein IMZ43_12235 [Thermoplasmata archaeon]|nr:hypothetical protein [Thermoplasmata archaeon]